MAPQPLKTVWWKHWWVITLGAFGALVVLVGVVGAVAGGNKDDVSVASIDDEDERGEPSESDGSTDTATPNDPVVPAPEGEIVDAESCVVVGEDTIRLEVTNNSSKQSSYFIDVNFLDAAGERVGDQTAYINYLRPGEHASEDQYVGETAGGTECEIAEVERYASESPDDLDEVTCDVTGVDFVEDVATVLTATNGSSKLSDYVIEAALVRDGIRIGTASAFIENVKPGESAPSDGFSTADGPAAGVTCEPVHVDRSDSSG
jgi:hypothetical protein